MALIDNAEAQALAASVKQLVGERCPLSKVREVAFGEQSYDPVVWEHLAQGVGLAGLIVPEASGGAGGTYADLVAALRELGAGLVPSPLLATVLATGMLRALDDRPTSDEWLPKLASGEAIGTLAVSEPGATPWIPARPATAATPADGTVTLSGTKSAVANAGDADVLLVVASGPDGVGGYLVARGAAGLTVTAERGLDVTRSIGTVTLDDTPARPVAGDAVAALEAVADLANLAVAAEQVGAMRSCIEATSEYAKVRYSFSQPIGAYQGVKHKLADLYAEWALADAAVRKAAEAGSSGSTGFPRAAAAARVLSSPAYVNAAKHMMLLHGGIGFTWEHDAHLYYRNAIASNVLFGDSEYQGARLADKLGV